MTMSRDDALAAISLVCEQERIRVPKLSLTSRQGHARASTWHISVPRWALATHEAYGLYYICHEIAHLIMRDRNTHNAAYQRKEQQLCSIFGVRITGYSHRGIYPANHEVRMA
ncbi:hypothetical protein HYS50_03375 [Candidatus Woesearchaeota archaeon]|nr:hypothetical protein [Candidatus Woesearchaeota archaeon]